MAFSLLYNTITYMKAQHKIQVELFYLISANVYHICRKC